MDITAFNQPKSPKLPFLVTNSAQVLRMPVIVVGRTFGGFMAVGWSIASDGIKVLSQIVPDTHFGNQYRVSTETDVKSALMKIKAEAIEHGASPEAVRLLSNHVTFDKKELSIMAEKLAKKSAPKEAKAKPAKATGDKPKRTGNPEALKKAREAGAAKSAEFLAKKITILVKPANAGIRGGRLAKLEALVAAKPKTVADALEVADIDRGALKGMERREHIRIG